MGVHLYRHLGLQKTCRFVVLSFLIRPPQPQTVASGSKLILGLHPQGITSSVAVGS